jgi:transposase
VWPSTTAASALPHWGAQCETLDQLAVIEKAGSSIARTVLCEAAWNYRTTPKVGQWMKERCPPVPQEIAALAWKAQLRLHKTYRRLTARGKRSVVATAAVARELLGFVWSIGRRVPLGA